MSNTQKPKKPEKSPLEAEAAGTTAGFTFRGVEFTVPLVYADMPLAYIEAASDGAPLAVQARELLGADQWAKVRGLGLTGSGLDELSDAINAAMGTDEGEDEASSA